MLVTVGLWWAYFDHVAGEAQSRLAAHHEPVLAAADAYSYLHLLLVSGIIVAAIGLKASVGNPGRQPRRTAQRRRGSPSAAAWRSTSAATSPLACGW